ncbi:HPr kinase/phosphorylase [Tropicimonas sp. IMCC34043]|uniref:HPr kinase/phosphorylase n=1 Tax=Tropicimonas sp. IMCC34043 TaxID=2248760 RepID=UPI000E22FDA5|nr:HPr kinase/phosphatase C-terminal domain-containing protein [Tropicimonas sp. IMCC34043]
MSPPEPGPERSTILHAGCVALQGRGLLILGRSGSGKSALALDLIALGAVLVADDRTRIRYQGGQLWAEPPAPIAGLIEARHVGLLRLPYRARAEVTLALDLDRPEPDRLPPLRNIDLLGKTIPVLFRPPAGHSTGAILQCLLQRREIP